MNKKLPGTSKVIEDTLIYESTEGMSQFIRNSMEYHS